MLRTAHVTVESHIRKASSLKPSLMTCTYHQGRHYWIQVLCRVPEALDKCQIALGKEHTAKKLIGKALFSECLLSGTRQRLCREPRGTRQRKATVTAPARWRSLCRVPTLQAHGKDFLFFLKKILCQVPPGQRSAKFEFFFKKKFFAECPLAGARQSLNCFF